MTSDKVDKKPDDFITAGDSKDSEDQLQFFLQNFLGIIYKADPNMQLISIKGAVEAITGFAPESFVHGLVAINRLIHPQDLPQLINDTDQMRAAPGKSHLIAREYRIISGDGKIRWVHEMVRNIIDASEGKTRFYQGIILDITMRKRIEEELEDKRLHLDGILNSLQDVVWSIAPDTFELLYLNPAAEKVYGYKLADFRKHPQLWTLMIHPEDSDPVVDNFTSLLERGEFEAEFRIIRADGEVRLINRRGYFGRDTLGVVARIDGIDTDITERRRTEERLVYLSLHDSLTGLYNRAYFEQEMQRLELEPETEAGIVVCDLDGLKYINDNLGHDWGDNLLVVASNIIKGCFRKDDIVSRIGGDEFAILLPGVDEPSLNHYCERINHAVDQYNKEMGEAFLSISVGCAARGPDINNMNRLFQEADRRMYGQKVFNSEKYRKNIANSIMNKMQGNTILNEEREKLLQNLAGIRSIING